MNRVLFFLALTILAGSWIPLGGLGVLIMGSLALKRVKGHRILFLGLLGIFGLRLLIQLPSAPVREGRVVEVNRNSVLIMSGWSKTLVRVKDNLEFALGDPLKVADLEAMAFSPTTYGFDTEAWAKANRITAQSDQIVSHEAGQGILAWVSRGGFNRDPRFISLMRAILFQVRDDPLSALTVSSGLIYSLLLVSLKKLCGWLVGESGTRLIQGAFLLWLGWGLGFPLPLIRVGVFLLGTWAFKDPHLRWSVEVLGLYLIEPYGFTQMAWVMPLVLESVRLFSLPKEGFCFRIFALSWVLRAFNLRFTWQELFLYPWFRKVYALLVLGIFLGLFVPGFTPWLVLSASGLDSLTGFLRRFALQSGRLSGLGGIFILGFWFLSEPWDHRLRLGSLVLVSGLILPWTARPWLTQVTMINVGQGDAILIQSPFNRSVVLIDTGPEAGYANLRATLDANGIRTLDALILTHADADHSANKERLEADFRVRETVLEPKDLTIGKLFLQALPLAGPFADENAASLVYGVNLENTRFLFAADIPIDIERKLVETYPGLRTDVLKLAHHGSKTSSSERFIATLQPDFAWISAGMNTYGHPSPEVLKRLDAFRIRSFLTREQGDIQSILSPFFRFFRDSKGRVRFF